MNAIANAVPAAVCHVVKGETLQGAEQVYGSGAAQFATPKLELDPLIWPRRDPGPAFGVPVAEIMDVLVATGEWITDRKSVV